MNFTRRSSGPFIRSTIPALVLIIASAAPAHAADPDPYVLDNGLRVLLRPVPEAEEVAVMVLFDLGGDHDPAGKSGRAHLLEHLYCTAAAGDSPPRDFTEIRKRYGTGYNQQTGADYTVLAGVVKAAQLEEELRDAVARLGDLRITAEDLQREVPRVLDELANMYGGIPTLAATNQTRLQLRPIPQDGRIGGTPEQIRALTLEELRETWRDYYRPNNATLVLAGGFEEAEARALVIKHFDPLEAGKEPPAKPEQPPAKTAGTERLKVKSIVPGAVGVVSIGYAAPQPGSENYPAFLLVVSRFYATMTQAGSKPGSTPTLYFPPLDDPSTIAIQTTLPADGNAVGVIADLELRLQNALQPIVTPLDKRSAVQQFALLGTIDFPPPMWASNLYGLAFGTARRDQLKLNGKALAKAINAVTDADVERLAGEVFAPEKRCIAVIEVE